MKQFGQVCAALRRKKYGAHSTLLAGCCFFSVLLITAYGIMMRSPTILAVLPEGGDSRKQVMMIFVLAVIGCAVFTVYAAPGCFPPPLPPDRHSAGAGGLPPPPAAAAAVPGAGGAHRRFLRRRGPAGRAAGLGHLAAVPPVCGGQRPDGPAF